MGYKLFEDPLAVPSYLTKRKLKQKRSSAYILNKKANRKLLIWLCKQPKDFFINNYYQL